MDEKTLRRYLNIKARAERGVDNEKDNATEHLRTMEGKYPGIAAAAAAFDRQQQNPATTASPGQGNWENIFRYADNLWKNVAGFAETVADALSARELADEVEIDVRVSRADNLIISAKMSLETYEQALTLDNVQRELFKREIRLKLEGVLTDLFEASDQELEEGSD